MLKRALLLFPFLISFVGNAQWQKLKVETESSFRSIDAVNDKIVWAGGSKGTILRTIDGGKTWQVIKVTNAETLDFRDIQGINDKTAYAMSAGDADKGAAKIFKTTDGGKTWQIIYETQEKGIFFDAMDFWDENEGIVLSDAIDDKPFILRTLDGGKTWKRIEKSKLSDIKTGEASFAASGTCVVTFGKNQAWVNTQSRVFYTKNKGETWEVAQTPFQQGQTSGIFGLHFWNQNHGVAVGGDYKEDKKDNENIALTNDGGKTWSFLTKAQPNGLKESGWWLGKETLLLVGTSGTSLTKDLGKTWQSIDNESFHAISCGKKTCFAIGAKGNLGRWEISR